MVFAGIACCGGTLILGAIGAQDELDKNALFDPTDGFDAGFDDETGETGETDDPALRAQFVAELQAGLLDAGHGTFDYDEEQFRMTSDAGAIMSLTNVYAEYAKAEPDDRPGYIEHTVQAFFPPELPEDWATARPNVLAVVRDRLVVELIRIQTDKAPELQRPVTDAVVELLVYDGEHSMTYVQPEHLKHWHLTADQAFAAGRKELARRSQKPFIEVSPGLYESAWQDNYDTSRMLLPETFKRLKLKGDPVVFLPQRDHLVVTGADDAAGLDGAIDLIDQYLQLPRSSGGRGWRLTAHGWVPHVPITDSYAAELVLNAVAKDANEQKEALDEKFTREGSDLFVGTTLLVQDDDGIPRSYAVWTKGVETLMPPADLVVFVDLDQPEDSRVVAAAPWKDVAKRLGKEMELDPTYWPPRYHLRHYPSQATLKALGLSPLFNRKSDETEE